jgi:hypothetical protein
MPYTTTDTVLAQEVPLLVPSWVCLLAIIAVVSLLLIDIVDLGWFLCTFFGAETWAAPSFSPSEHGMDTELGR